MTQSSVPGLIVLLFLLTFAVGSAFAFDPASDLIVHYEFENSIADSAGSSDGSFYNGGGGNTYAPGPTGNALYLDGSGGVAVPGSVLRDMAGKTVACWIKIDACVKS